MLSRVRLFVTLWTVARQAPLSMGFSSKNTMVSCHFLLQSLFSTQGSNPHLLRLLHWQVDSSPLAPPGKPQGHHSTCKINSVQLLSCIWLFATSDCGTPSFPVCHQLPELTQTYVHWVGDAIQPSHSLSSPSLPALNPSQHQGLFSESVLHIRWPKYWSLSFSISPSNECSGLISFRNDWFDLLAAQGTLKSLLQHHSFKASILQRSAFFIVQLSHPYMTTGKTIALTRQMFVDKVIFLLFNMLSSLIIAFLPRRKHLLTSWCSHHLKWFWNPK